MIAVLLFYHTLYHYTFYHLFDPLFRLLFNYVKYAEFASLQGW